MTRVERRTAARVPARLAMELTLAGGKSRTETLNVSANGVYFASTGFIPLLTKLRITLELPEDGASPSRVTCDGVVVRIEPEEETAGERDYQVACYFTDISDGDRERLESYILRHVPF